MRKLFLVAIFLLPVILSFGQADIAVSVCKCLDRLKPKMDKLDFEFASQRCMKDAYAKSISFTSRDSTEGFIMELFNTLRRDCSSFNTFQPILEKYQREKSNVNIRDRSSCKKIVQVGEFKETGGYENIWISMRDSVQILRFGESGIYTKSRIEWIDECTYKTIFVESTNPYENSILKQGDERVVRIIKIDKKGEVILEVGMLNHWFVNRMKKLK